MIGARPETLVRGTIARHRHVAPYVAIVLAGGYEEAGDSGRFRVAAGDVLVHGAYSAHCDTVAGGAAIVLNLTTDPGIALPPRGRVADPDLIARIAERDRRAAGAALAAMFEPVAICERDDADALAACLIGAGARIGDWSAARGRPRETISRQFSQLYGIDAARFRREARARRAWRMIVDTALPLAEIAVATGHAD